jgi:putative transposase
MSKENQDGNLPTRRSMRHPNHNYRWTASYFVTIRAAHHEPVFEIDALRSILQEQWTAIPQHFPSVMLDEFVIMPDHIHGILHFFVTATAKKAPSLGDVIGRYKSTTTVIWFRYQKTHNIFWSGLLWQRNYHDHVIRDDDELTQKRHYILENPQRWAENPDRPYS